MVEPKPKRWIWTALRWAIAVIGVAWVVNQLTLRDHVLVVLDATNRPVEVVLLSAADDDSAQFTIEHPETSEAVVVPRGAVVNAPDRASVRLADGREVDLLGMRLGGDLRRAPEARHLLVADPDSDAPGFWIEPGQVQGGAYHLHVPRPLVMTGLASMVRQANPWLLAASVFVFPVTFLITTVRWQMLLRAADVRLPLRRTFVLNMVGCFYSTFMPGLTGGDVLKAYYVARQTQHRLRAVVSVFVDRLLGLLALLILGGIMAAWLYAQSDNPLDPVARASRKIALAAVVVLAGAIVAIWVVGHPLVRRRLGFDMLLRRLPMQQRIESLLESMRIYKRRPLMVLWALIMTMPVHVTTIVSAMLAGMAFALPISIGYYFVSVPVIVLSGALPLSPQGVGVMEYFAFRMTERQGATIGQALVLTMSIRLVQMLWNLAGGVFVLRGGFQAPRADEVDRAIDEPLRPSDESPGGREAADAARR